MCISDKSSLLLNLQRAKQEVQPKQDMMLQATQAKLLILKSMIFKMELESHDLSYWDKFWSSLNPLQLAIPLTKIKFNPYQYYNNARDRVLQAIVGKVTYV